MKLPIEHVLHLTLKTQPFSPKCLKLSFYLSLFLTFDFVLCMYLYFITIL